MDMDEHVRRSVESGSPPRRPAPAAENDDYDVTGYRLPAAEQPAGETEESVRARFRAMLNGEPEPARELARPMTGFFGTLSPAQQEAALAYRGPENHGDPAFASRRGDWLQTFSGRQFWPMDPRASEIAIEDIAHALSMQCRYAGHCLRFYSVAEHSVLLARYFHRQGASTTVQLWALLHDASEAYLVDVPRPVKPFLPGYKEAEAAVMRAVCDRFALPHEMPAEVHAADGAIIGNERDNMAPCVAQWYATGPGLEGVYLRNWQAHVAELEFTAEFRRLMDERFGEGQRRAA